MAEDMILSVVIRAEDEASASIGKIKGELGSISGAATTSAGAVNSALLSTTQQVGKLEQSLAKQKNVTRHYNEDLRTATKNLKAQKTAMSEAVKSYEQSKAATKANNAELTVQARSLDGAINLKKSEISSYEKANKSLDSNTQAYKDNKKAISWCTTELDDLKRQRKGIDTQISKNNSALQKEEAAYRNAQTAVKRASAEYENIKAARDKSITAEKDYSNAIKQSSEKNAGALRITSEQLEKAGKGTKDFFGDVDNITKPLQVASVGIIAAGAASAKAAIDFEDDFANVKKTVDGTPEELKEIEQGLIDLYTVGINGGKAIPATTRDLTELAAAGGQLGIEVPNIVGFTEAMAQLDSATDLGGVDGAQTIAQLMNVANVDQGKIKNLGSTIVDLGNNYATTESKIANMALRVGATSTTIGFDIQDTLAYSTALSSMGVEAEAGGSALSRIMMDVQTAVSSGGSALKGFAKVSGESVQQFKKDWEEDSAEQLLDLIEGLSESEDKIKTLQELGFNNIYDIQALQKLASEKGIDVLTDALERANTAWDENIALQREADAKAETTAGKLIITKNNIVEVGRSFGEFIIPVVAEASDDIRDFAQGLAGLRDEQKTGIVNTAKNIAIAGVATKGLVAAGKGIGGIMEGVDGIGKVIKAVKGAEAGTALAKVAAVAGPAALGIAGVTTALVIGKVAYDEWYDSNYRWTEGLSEGNEKIQDSISNFKRVSSLKKEIQDLKLVIENPESSSEQIDKAKLRLDEIVALLEKEYNLVINSDNSNLDNAIDNLTKQSENDLQFNINNQMAKLANLRDEVANYEANYAAEEANYQAAFEKQTKYGDMKNSISYLDRQYEEGNISLKERNEAVKELALTNGFATEIAEHYGEVLNAVNEGYASATSDVNKYSGRIKALRASKEELIAVSTELANWETELISLYAKEGNTEGVNKALEIMRALIADAGLDLEGYTEAAVLAKNGITSLNDAWAASGETLNNIVNDYISVGQQLGMTLGEAVAGAALIKEGFKGVEEATASGEEGVKKVIASMKQLGEEKGLFEGLDASGIAEKLTEMAQTLGIIKENQVITIDGTVIWTNDTTKVDEYEPEPKTATVTYGVVISGLDKIPRSTAGSGWKITPQAKGTQNFPGGLAMVNDETGIADNRELIIDRGCAFIPQGRNVILPLSRGARVYTASQTKALARALGIPGFASGKDNSDGFVAARDALSHRKATSAMTVTEELNEWIRLSKEYTSNQKDVWDIQEEIFSLTRKQTEELNKQSEAYISTRTALGDWAEYGDDPISAYNRIKERNLAELEAGRITWDEYSDTMYSAGEKMLDDRVKQSEEWISFQKKYGNMSTEEEMAAYQRIQAYTLQYYEQGLINLETYRAAASDTNEKYLDADIERRAAEFERWEKDMENWIKIRETYGDWDEYGDSLSQTYARSINRIDDLYARGIISWQEAEDKKLEYSLEMYKAASDEYDEVLAEQQERIDEMRDEFAKEEEALRDSWAVSDRKADLSEVNQLLRIYKNASTEAGQERYKELLKQKEQLERDEQLYQLEVKNNAVIEQLEAEYKRLEENKKQVLSRLKIDCGTMSDAGLDISATSRETYELARAISLDYTAAAESTLVSLGEVVNLLEGIKKVLGGRSTNTYNDNKTVNIAGGMSESAVSRVINGTVVSGFGSVIFGG